MRVSGGVNAEVVANGSLVIRTTAGEMMYAFSPGQWITVGTRPV